MYSTDEYIYSLKIYIDLWIRFLRGRIHIGEKRPHGRMVSIPDFGSRGPEVSGLNSDAVRIQLTKHRSFLYYVSIV